MLPVGPFSKKTGTWVVLIFVMIVFAIASTMFSMESHMIDYDNACHFYYSVYINEGKIPYRDFSLFKTPLYMYVVSMFFSVFGVGFEQILALNIFINAVTIVGIYLFGREVKNPTVGLVASAFYALSYFSVLIHVAGKTEPLFNLLLVYAILFLVKPRPREPLKSIASPLLLALAFYNLPRASIPALGGIALTLLTTSTLRRTLRYLGLFTIFATAMSAPFLILAPTEFFYNVFLFNTLRGFQNTPGVSASIQWLLERGSLTLFTFGTLGLLLTTLHAWNRLPKPLHSLAPHLQKNHATLLASLFLLFWIFLALPQFAYPYMIYPIWPLLATGAALLITPLIKHVLNITFHGSSSQVRTFLPLLILLLLTASVIAFDVTSTMRDVNVNIIFWRTRMADMDAIVNLIEEQTNPEDAVLSFTPSLSSKINRPIVFPQNPSGSNPDLINYFPFRTFVLMMENETQPFKLTNLLTIRSTLRDIQTKIQTVEFSELLSDVKILVLEEDYLATQIPKYDQTFGQIIQERCELLASFSWISVYLVT
jgi:hypothetical protein